MKGISHLLMLAVVLLSGCRQERGGQSFIPYATTALRLPAVPLIVSDPYLSIWSVTDHLAGGTTRHWTEDEKPLTGLLRVDGELYRFMGAPQKHVMNTIAPMADEARWEARTSLTLQAGWQQSYALRGGWQFYWQAGASLTLPKWGGLFHAGGAVGIKIPVRDHFHNR